MTFPSSGYNSTTHQENPFSFERDPREPEPDTKCNGCPDYFFDDELDEDGLCPKCHGFIAYVSQHPDEVESIIAQEGI